jgi:hypothetical protein
MEKEAIFRSKIWKARRTGIKNKRIFWKYPGKWKPHLIKNTDKIRLYEKISYKNPNLFFENKMWLYSITTFFRRSGTKTQNVL